MTKRASLSARNGRLQNGDGQNPSPLFLSVWKKDGKYEEGDKLSGVIGRPMF